MENKIKRGLFYLAFIILFLPLVQQGLQFIISAPLKGGFRPAADTSLSLSSWQDASYQHQKEQFLNDHTGFRSDLVRLTNQIDFSLFDKCHAGWTVKGKNRQLYQAPYISAYFGRDFIGYATIKDQSVKLKAIQDTLDKLGKSLLLVYLPSKASFYPEYFPDNSVTTKHATNYETYRHICDSLGVRQVDMNAWFMSMKRSSKEPLFSKQGIHYTNYGAILCGDSLTRYMEQLSHIQVQHPIWNTMEHTTRLRAGDDDIAQELNLIFPEATETLAYPIIEDVPDTGRKINAIYIGDSYAHKMTEFGIIYKMNGQCEYWGYFDEMHDINGHKFAYIKDYDWIGAIGRADCVVLSYTLFNFTQLGNGFIDKAYAHYYPLSLK